MYTLLAALFSATSALLEDEGLQCQLDCFSRGGSSHHPREVLKQILEAKLHSETFDHRSVILY